MSNSSKSLIIAICCLAGCVDGTPFEPEICEMQADTSGVTGFPQDSVNVLRYCRLPGPIKTETKNAKTG